MQYRNERSFGFHRSSYFYRTALALSLLCVLGTGCTEPRQLITEDYYGSKDIVLPNGDHYELDIAMITPFAGHINPRQEDVCLYIVDDKVYNKLNKKLDSLKCSAGECTKIDNSNIILEDNRLKLKLSSNRELDCTIYSTYENIPEAIRFNFMKEAVPSPNIQYAYCPYDLGGAYALHKTWNSLKQEGIPQVRVSSGDSFGTSADISARLGDIPTPIILDAAGLQIDTFGNHSFDKNLDYLKTVLSWTNYKYLGTNLTNVPQNLAGIAPRILVDVPAQSPKDADPLRVAFVSALDMEATATVFPGRFGSLSIGNYCNLIQSIEDAYNDGARAFFILAHLYTQKASIKAVFNAISYFYDHDAYTSLFSYQDVETYEEFTTYEAYINSEVFKDKEMCASVLEIPTDIIKAKYAGKSGKDGREIQFVSDINFKDETQVKIYQDIIQDMHHEIYQGIIGILGEGSSTPLAVRIKPEPQKTIDLCALPQSEQDLAYASFDVSGCKKNENINNDPSFPKPNLEKNFDFIDYLRNFDLLENFNPQYFYKNNNVETVNKTQFETSCYANDDDGNLLKFFDEATLYCRNVRLNEDDEENHENRDIDDHSILYIQFPSESASTAQLRVAFKRNSETQTEKRTWHHYAAIPTTLTYKNVIDTENSNHDNAYENQSYETCYDLLNSIDKSTTGDGACLNYLNWRANQETFLKSIEELKGVQYESPEGESYDISNELNTCFKTIESYSNADDKNDDSRDSDTLLHKINAINCLYLSSARFLCPSDENLIFKDISLNHPVFNFTHSQLWDHFELDSVQTSASEYEREFTTFKTNLAIDSTFHYLQKSHENIFDFAMSNAGDLRNLSEPQTLTYGNLVKFAPYDSIMMHVQLPISAFVQIIDNAFERSDGSYGGYPIFSGIVVSTKNEKYGDKYLNHVQEIWLTDPNGALKEPIFIKLDSKNNPNCNKTENTINSDLDVACAFAKYEINQESSDKKTGTLSATPNNLFYCLDASNQYTQCSEQMKFDGEIIDYINNEDSKEYHAWIKPGHFNLLTSSYLTSGGDSYNFTGNNIQYEPVKEQFSTKDYIMAYLSKDASVSKDSVCNDNYHDTTIQQTYDGLNTDQTICRFLLNKHFQIDTNYMINDTIIKTRYVLSYHVSPPHPTGTFDKTCNSILYP